MADALFFHYFVISIFAVLLTTCCQLSVAVACCKIFLTALSVFADPVLTVANLTATNGTCHLGCD